MVVPSIHLSGSNATIPDRIRSNRPNSAFSYRESAFRLFDPDRMVFWVPGRSEDACRLTTFQQCLFATHVFYPPGMTVQRTARANRQQERSHRTRERVLNSTVELIRREGLSSASPVKIAQHTGVSWGAVQHHFGSKEQLLRKIVLLSRDRFTEAVAAQDYSGLDLDQRISLFVDCAWEHYQSDVFLASVEITFWHRNNGFVISEDISGDNGRTIALTRATIEQVFAETGARIENLVDAHVYMHCVLTGLAFHDILSGSNDQIRRHLAHCKHAMAEIVAGPAQ